MYTICWRLPVRVTSNVVKTTTKAASLGREVQSTYKLCENIFEYPHRQLSAPLHKAHVVKKQTREAVIYFHNTLPSDLGDWKKCYEARFTSFDIYTPSI